MKIALCIGVLVLTAAACQTVEAGSTKAPVATKSGAAGNQPRSEGITTKGDAVAEVKNNNVIKAIDAYFERSGHTARECQDVIEHVLYTRSDNTKFLAATAKAKARDSIQTAKNGSIFSMLRAAGHALEKDLQGIEKGLRKQCRVLKASGDKDMSWEGTMDEALSEFIEHPTTDERTCAFAKQTLRAMMSSLESMSVEAHYHAIALDGVLRKLGEEDTEQKMSDYSDRIEGLKANIGVSTKVMSAADHGFVATKQTLFAVYEKCGQVPPQEDLLRKESSGS